MAQQLPSRWVIPPEPVVGILGTVDNEPDIHERVIQVLKYCCANLDQIGTGVRTAPKLTFKSLADDYVFPKKKRFNESKENSERLLKPNWMEKQCDLVSTLVFLVPFGVDWTMAEWQRQETTILSKFVDLVGTLKQRECAVHLVATYVGKGIAQDPEILTSRLDSLKASLQLDNSSFHHFAIKELNISTNQFALGTGAASSIGVNILVQKLFRNVREASTMYYMSQCSRALQRMEFRIRQTLPKPGESRGGPGASDMTYIGQIRGKYNFKAAYFCDFQGLHQQALGYYRNCFQSLISVVENVQDHLLGELQLMTELCNYKICRYLVSASMVSDAILQFEEHMAAIKSCYPTQLDFVHHGWMAKQYIVFVNLLDYADINSDGHSKNSERVQTATGKPLSRQTIQHSRAQYFLSAAQCEVRRQETFERAQDAIRQKQGHGSSEFEEGEGDAPLSPITPLYSTDASLTSLSNSLSMSSLSPTPNDRNGENREVEGSGGLSPPLLESPGSSRAPTPQLDTPGTLAVTTLKSHINLELRVDHEQQIMSLLQQAHEETSATHYRRKAHVLSLIAEQHMQKGRFETAYTNLGVCADLLAVENWSALLVPFLRKRMACAIYLGRSRAYLRCAMTLYSLAVDDKSKHLLGRYEREELHRDLMSVVSSYGRAGISTSISGVSGVGSGGSPGQNSAQMGTPVPGQSPLGVGSYVAVPDRPEFSMASTDLGPNYDPNADKTGKLGKIGGADGSDKAEGVDQEMCSEYTLPHNYCFELSSFSSRDHPSLIRVTVIFDSRSPVEVGSTVSVQLEITSLFLGRMRFSEMDVRWTDDLFVSRFVNPKGLPVRKDKEEDPAATGTTITTTTATGGAVSFPLEFDYNKPVRVPVEVTLREEDFATAAAWNQQASKSSTQREAFLCVERVDFKLRSVYPVTPVIGSSSSSATTDLAKEEAKEAHTPATPAKGDAHSSSATPPGGDGDTRDFILTVHTLPPDLVNRRKNDKAMGQPPSVRFEEYAMSTPGRVSGFLEGSVESAENSVCSVGGLNLSVTKTTPVSNLSLYGFRVLHIVPPAATVEMMGAQMAQSWANPSVRDATPDGPACATLLTGPVQRVNVVFGTGGGSVLRSRLSLSVVSNSNSNEPEPLFWYPDVENIASTSKGQTQTQGAEFFSLKTAVGTANPIEPFLLQDVRGSSSGSGSDLFVVPLYVKAGRSCDVRVQLALEYQPREGIKSRLERVFSLDIRFVRPFDMSFTMQTLSEVEAAVSLVDTSLTNAITPTVSDKEAQGVVVVRGDTLAMSANLVCLNALGSGVELVDFRLERPEIMGGKGRRPAFTFSSSDMDSLVHTEGGLALLDEPTTLTQGEEYTACADIHCAPHAQPALQPALEALWDTLLSTGPSSALPLPGGEGGEADERADSDGVSAGQVYLVWRRDKDDLLLPVLAPNQQSTARPSSGDCSWDWLPRLKAKPINKPISTSTSTSTNANNPKVVKAEKPKNAEIAVWSSASIQSSCGGDVLDRSNGGALSCTRDCAVRFGIPPVRVRSSPFSVKVHMEPQAVLGRPIGLRVEITNHLPSTEKLRLGLGLGAFTGKSSSASATTATAGGSGTVFGTGNGTSTGTTVSDDLGMSGGLKDHFLVTGPASQSLVLPPHSTATTVYALLPLTCGHCKVPRLTASWEGHSNQGSQSQSQSQAQEVAVLDLQRELFVEPPSMVMVPAGTINDME